MITAHQVDSYGPNVTETDRTAGNRRGSTSPADRVDAQRYEIRVTGRLAQRWAAWFDGMEISSTADGTSVIRGPVVDQAALHGLIQKLRDLGLPLESLVQLGADDPPRTDASGRTATTNTTPGEPQ